MYADPSMNADGRAVAAALARRSFSNRKRPPVATPVEEQHPRLKVDRRRATLPITELVATSTRGTPERKTTKAEPPATAVLQQPDAKRARLSLAPRRMVDLSADAAEIALGVPAPPAIDTPAIDMRSLDELVSLPSPSPSSVEERPPAADSPEAEALLRAFDYDTTYGPCVGPTRLQRWRRAERWGLQPPPAVAAILERLGEDDGRRLSVYEQTGGAHASAAANLHKYAQQRAADAALARRAADPRNQLTARRVTRSSGGGIGGGGFMLGMGANNPWLD